MLQILNAKHKTSALNIFFIALGNQPIFRAYYIGLAIAEFLIAFTDIALAVDYASLAELGGFDRNSVCSADDTNAKEFCDLRFDMPGRNNVFRNRAYYENYRPIIGTCTATVSMQLCGISNPDDRKRTRQPSVLLHWSHVRGVADWSSSLYMDEFDEHTSRQSVRR